MEALATAAANAFLYKRFMFKDLNHYQRRQTQKDNWVSRIYHKILAICTSS